MDYNSPFILYKFILGRVLLTDRTEMIKMIEIMTQTVLRF